ncbi:MAG: sensor histidine kinase, partial [Spirochaetota bacterium]
YLIEFFRFDDYIEMFEEYMYHTGSVIRTHDAPSEIQSSIENNSTVQSLSSLILDAADEFIAAPSEDELLDSLNTIISRIFTYDSIDILLLHENRYHLIYSRNSVTGDTYEYPVEDFAFYHDIFKKNGDPLMIMEMELEEYASSLHPFPGLSAMKSALIMPVIRSGKLVGLTVIGFRDNKPVSPFYADIVNGITCLAYMSYDNFISQKRRRKLESEVLRHEKLIALGSIVAGVAHEINNPLSIMQLDLEELAQITPSTFQEQLPEIAESLSQEMARIKAILQQLKDYVKPESITDGSKLESVEICELFRKYPLKIMVKSYRKKGIRVEVNCRQRIYAHISRNNIEQVLMNLISNAGSAVSENDGVREIEIEAYIGMREQNRLAVIEIRDNGCGIAPKHIDRIFDPFFTTKQAEGTGLGLSICYSIIRRYNGNIHVSSVEGEGTVMTIELPVIQDA